MNIRKHWKKVLLSSTAFFWASCGGDSESASVTSAANNETPPDSITTPDDLDGIKTDTLYGVSPVYDIDSGAVSSSDACESSSSAEETLSSSSETESSSSYDPSIPYRLASDPSIHCAWENFVGATFECLDGQDYQATVRWKKEQLANNQKPLSSWTLLKTKQKQSLTNTTFLFMGCLVTHAHIEIWELRYINVPMGKHIPPIFMLMGIKFSIPKKSIEQSIPRNFNRVPAQNRSRNPAAAFRLRLRSAKRMISPLILRCRKSSKKT